jgi:ubiquinone/menaquinone biosynthesis C-methylase UbiE
MGIEKIKKQTWWDTHIKTQTIAFYDWVGDLNVESRKYFMDFLNKKQFLSIIDIGCGPAIMLDAIKAGDMSIDYMGVDSSEVFCDMNIDREVPMIRADAHNIPVSNGSYEIAYSRHVWEHQPDFRPLLDEMLRVASKMVVHNFFLKPSEKENIEYSKEHDLYHCTFSRIDIEDFLFEHDCVDKFNWEDINKEENILFIELKS